MTAQCERPGGLALTQRLFDIAALPRGARVLDVGCGQGTTVEWLRREGAEAFGVDTAPPPGQKPYFYTADAAKLPFDDHSFEAVLFECSLSRIAQPEAALRAAHRVLRRGGALLCGDMYSREPQTPTPRPGALGRLEGMQTQLARFFAAGFDVVRLQYHDAAVTSYWAQLVFEQGPAAALACLGFAAGGEKPGKMGYYTALLRPLPPHAVPVASAARLQPLCRWVTARTGLGGNCTPETLRRWQLEQAAKTVESAKRNSPFFSEHLHTIDAGSIWHAGHLHALPLTNADTLREQAERLLCTGLGQVARVRTVPTSGSTGPPKRVWFTEEDQLRTVDFFAHGMWPIAPQNGTVAILMSGEKPGSIAQLLQHGLARIGAEGRVCGRPAGLAGAQKALQGATCAVGLPADLLYLCRKLPHLRLGAVLLSADYIAPAAIAAIQEAWHCRVFCHYGLTETGYGLAVQCPAGGGQHIRHADFLVEIVHPHTLKPLPPGQEGEIVLTSLQPRALPLVRYRTGDVASLQEGPCPCGCSLPRLGPVRGRIANLQTPLNIHQLDDLLFALPGVAGYRATFQNGTLHLTIEGALPDESLLQKVFGVPVTAENGPAAPWLCEGKRSISGWPPTAF